MKIVCEHCGAKYSIPDDKVAGKTFKIRCKKCSALLVLRGDQSEEVPTKSNPGLTAEWHVVIEGEQQGPLTIAQLKTLFSNGKANWDSFVWRDGMSDWILAQDIAELPGLLGIEKPASTGEAKASPQERMPTPDAPPAAIPESSSQSSGDMFSAFDVTIDAPAATTAAAGAGASASSSAAEPFAAAASPQPTAAAQPASFAGQRHENSVLFSLGNLKAMASQGKGGAPASSSAASSSSSNVAPASSIATPQINTPASSPARADASGLFDIRALMQQSAASSAQARQSEPSSSRNSSAAELFRADSGMVIPATLGVPALPSSMPPAEKKQRYIWIGAAAGGALVFLALVVLLVSALRKPEQVTVGPGGTVQTPAPVVTDTPAPAPEKRPTQQTQPSKPAPTPAVAANNPLSAAPASNSAMTSTRKPKTPASTTAAPRKTPIVSDAPARSSSKDKDIDDLMNDVLDGGAGKKPRGGDDDAGAARVDSSLPSSPSRNDVLEALNGVSGAVRSCGGSKSGVANVAVVFAGTTGRVKSANIAGGEFKGTPEGKCIEKAVERARIPRFQQATFKVTFPYRI